MEDGPSTKETSNTINCNTSSMESARMYRRLIVLLSVLLTLMVVDVHSFQTISISSPASQVSSRTLSSGPSKYVNSIASNSVIPTVLFGKKDARKGGNANASREERVRKPRDDVIEVEAIVQESLPNAMFRCALSDGPENQPIILATISGKIRKNYVKILVGDRVLIELSPYDLTRGRITFRYRS